MSLSIILDFLSTHYLGPNIGPVELWSLAAEAGSAQVGVEVSGFYMDRSFLVGSSPRYYPIPGKLSTPSSGQCPLVWSI
jgi:hypothetical protein